MTENAPENSRSQSLVDALIRLRWYKYIALFLISVLFSVFASYDFEQNKFFPGDLLSGLYIAFITGLIFSIIYDLFIHSETEKANEARDEDLAKKLSKEILGAYGIEILPKPQAKLFLQSIVDDSNSLQVLAELVSSDPAISRAVQQGVFTHLWKAPLMENVSIYSRMLPISGDDVHYLEKKRTTFRYNREKKVLRCFVTGNNDIGACLNFASDGCDIAVFASNIHGDIETILSKTPINLTHKFVQGQKLLSESVIKTVYVQDILSLYPHWPEHWSQKIAVIDFDLSSNNPGSTYELCIEFKNRYNDNFCYQVVHQPSYVQKIEIDYSLLRENLGRVSVIPLGPSGFSELDVDKENGLVNFQPNTLLWPGQGLFILWRSATPESRSAIPQDFSHEQF